jgi:hypothetical protein
MERKAGDKSPHSKIVRRIEFFSSLLGPKAPAVFG